MGWNTVKLSDVSKLVKGVTFAKSDASSDNDEKSTPIIRAGNIQKELLLETDLVFIPNKKVKQAQLIKKNDIIMCTSSGSASIVGKCAFAYNDWEGSFGAFNICIRPNVEVDPKYLFQYLRSPKFKDWSSLSSGANIKNIRSTELANFPIPLPPLATQKKIATILDAADALRKKTQQIIDSYDELAQSIFLDMFGDPVTNPKGWEKKKVNDVSKKIQIGPFGTQLHQSDYIENGIPLINPTNIVNKRIHLEKIVYISNEKYLSLPQYHLKPNDIIMARRGDLSKVGLIQDDLLFCGTGSLYIRFKKDINGTFIHRLLSDNSTTNYLMSKAQGITMPNLNKGIISNIPIYTPPLPLQNQFADKITLIEQQKELAKQSLKESEYLFNALLQKAFKGELV